MEYNIYGDESCHLSFDNFDCMILGAIQTPLKNRKRICDDIKKIKLQHHLSKDYELKWTKVGRKKIDFYYDIIDYIFMELNLNFKCLILKNKDELIRTNPSNEEYNLWYYRMYYMLINEFISPDDHYSIYMDIKDTKSGDRIKMLQKVLCNNIYDFKSQVIKKIQLIRSEESEIIQLVDLLIGAIGYYFRNKESIDLGIDKHEGLSETKIKIIRRIQEKTGLNLTTSSRTNSNFNIIVIRGKFNEI